MRHASIFIAAASMIFGGGARSMLPVAVTQRGSASLSFRKRALSGILWRKLKS
ncbi:hypothetical protein [Microbulbifer sp. THAF38]|uniref:hypothetical protein n=1 Tax=Microbulbifer sp. THAF38 TaxID=2587856 RepID=UPI0015629B1A|nr:hypothetical protein [Microbulbifer sp. THAF38]